MMNAFSGYRRALNWRKGGGRKGESEEGVIRKKQGRNGQ
jgi:hypothetical protein